MSRALMLLSALALGACSFVNAPADHMGGARDAGPDTGAPDAGLEPIPYDQYCNELAVLACESADACCTLGEPTPTCVAEVRTGCDSTFGATLLVDPRTGYDGMRAAEAFVRARALAATCDVAILAWYGDQRMGFPSALAGSVGGGEVCTPTSLDMKSFDAAAFYSCIDDDQACIYNGTDRFTCTARAAAGGVCYFSTDCADDHFCDYAATGGIPGVCAPQRAPGGACTERGSQCLDVCYEDQCVAPEMATVYCAFAPTAPP